MKSTNKTVHASQMNSKKINDDRNVRRIKKSISKDVAKQEIAVGDKLNATSSSVINKVPVSVAKKIVKLDNAHNVNSDNLTNINIDKTKIRISQKDSSKVITKSSKNDIHIKSTSDLKQGKSISSLPSKVMKDKGSVSERKLVVSNPIKIKTASKAVDNNKIRTNKASKKTAEVPPKRTVDHFKFDKKPAERPPKTTPTNVTVNSPVHKRSENYIEFEESLSVSSTSDAIFGDNLQESEQKHNHFEVTDENKSKKHQRFRTRTLESHEVKLVGNPENVDINAIGMKSLISGVNNAVKPIVNQPEAFYVSLEEKKISHEITVPHKKSPDISHSPEDNNSVSYDDDFESYESDFESCSSSTSIKLSNTSSIGSDNSEIVSDNTIDIVSSKTDIKIFESIKDDEKHLDSGNYDLRDVNSKPNSTREDVMDNAHTLMQDNLKSADSARHISYTDEGFDENSGGFSSTSILSKQEEQSMLDNTFDISSQFFDRSLKHKKNESSSRQKLRVKELLGLIVLDTVKYSLFDMPPIAYDIFMKTFGKSNSTQGSSQTNDDNIEEAIQTDFTDYDNKWTQCPVDFSDNEITLISNSAMVNDKVVDNNVSKNAILLGNLRKHSVKNYEKIVFVKLLCPLQIYCKQRMGCSIEDLYTKEEVDKKIIYGYKSLFSKTVKFVRKTGNMMISYLNERCHSIDAGAKQKSEFPFSKKYTTLLPDTFDSEILKDRPPAILSFSENSVNSFLTVHHEKNITTELLEALDMKKILFMRTLICIWTWQNCVATTPVKVLVAVEDINCCAMSGGLTGIVVSGSENGTLYAWDLNESDSGELLISKVIEENNLLHTNGDKLTSSESDKNPDGHKRNTKVTEVLLRSCSFSNLDMNSINKTSSWNGPIVDIVFLKSMTSTNVEFEKKIKFNNQVSTLHQHGILTIWTIINSVPLRVDDPVSADSYNSKLILLKSYVIDIRKSLQMNSSETSLQQTSDSTNSGNRFPEFDLITARRRNSLKKGDITVPFQNDVEMKNRLSNKLMFDKDKTKISLFGQEIKNANKIFLDIDTKKKLESDLYDAISIKGVIDSEKMPTTWDGNMICSKVKHLVDKNAAGHFLIACNGGKLVHHLQSSLQNKSFLFMCGDNAASTSCLEICPYQIPYFLVGCHDSTIHLYSLDSPRPIKNFICLNNVDQFTYLSNPQYSINKESTTGRDLKSIHDKKYLGNDIVSVQWSTTKPCRFYAISKTGKFLEWDLTNSDVSQKLYGYADPASQSIIQKLKIMPIIDGESQQKREFMILQFESGEIQVHSMEDDYNSNLEKFNLEKKLLLKYLELF